MPDLLDYKKYLCQIISDLGGEVTVPKETAKFILHFFEDDDEMVLCVDEIGD